MAVPFLAAEVSSARLATGFVFATFYQQLQNSLSEDLREVNSPGVLRFRRYAPWRVHSSCVYKCYSSINRHQETLRMFLCCVYARPLAAGLALMDADMDTSDEVRGCLKRHAMILHLQLAPLNWFHTPGRRLFSPAVSEDICAALLYRLCICTTVTCATLTFLGDQ